MDQVKWVIIPTSGSLIFNRRGSHWSVHQQAPISGFLRISFSPHAIAPLISSPPHPIVFIISLTHTKIFVVIAFCFGGGGQRSCIRFQLSFLPFVLIHMLLISQRVYFLVLIVIVFLLGRQHSRCYSQAATTSSQQQSQEQDTVVEVDSCEEEDSNINMASSDTPKKKEYLQDGPEAKEIAQYLPYFPFKGIPRFYDIGGFLYEPDIFQKIVNIFVDRYSTEAHKIDVIAGLDARGFILGPPIALALKIPFIMMRKKGKMPNSVSSEEYNTEYGS